MDEKQAFWKPAYGSSPITSLTACRNRCLHPRYRSVVATETWPRRNWICSSSPPAAWHNRAHVRRQSCGASCWTPTVAAYFFTIWQTTFSVMPPPQIEPVRLTHRNTRPCTMAAVAAQSSSATFTQSGTGTVRMCRPLPTRSTTAQCSSRRWTSPTWSLAISATQTTTKQEC